MISKVSRNGKSAQGILVALLLALVPASALSKPAWDQEANIKDAAKRLALLHRGEGSQGVVKFLDACYKTHTIASEFSAGLEACMTQDYIHSRVLAEIYAKLPEEARAKLHAPSAEFIARTMNARFAAIRAQYKMSDADADTLKKSIDKVGLPIFIKSAFPPKKDVDGKGGNKGHTDTDGENKGEGDKK